MILFSLREIWVWRDGFKIASFLLIAGLLSSCSSQPELEWHEEDGYRWAELSPGYFGRTGFQQLNPSATGVTFVNFASEEDISENRNFLNGAGVAAGDIDGDGLVDLYFTQLNGPNKLYKNLGNFKFRDITDSADVALEGYNSAGALFADVNGNGHLDLLVTSMRQQNVLFLNDGNGRFELKTDSGLGQSNGSTTMALADIDGDGYPDLYITNYRLKSVRDMYDESELTQNRTLIRGPDGELSVVQPFDEYYALGYTDDGQSYRYEYGARDQLYINNRDGTFTEITDLKERFLDVDGSPLGLERDWGLAASFQDINGNGYPDLYVVNDFSSPDRIWINQGDGTFKALPENAISNLSFSSMGIGFSDINRDGAIDFYVTEMLSESHQDRMRQFSADLGAIGGRPLYNRNSLYLNRGDNTFSEISYYSGVEATGWSWAADFMDVDLDGYEDLIVTTGNLYDLQDMDTQLGINQSDMQNSTMNRDSGILAYPSLELTNKIFRNNHDLTFSDKSADWGFNTKDVSHGMAFADLNNDGDLDLVVSRLNNSALIYENTGNNPRIAVRLRGTKPNTQAIGAKITLTGGPVEQSKEIISGGNYLSGSDPLAVFAANRDNTNHKISITWPGGTQTVIDSVKSNRIYEISELNNGLKPDSSMKEIIREVAPVFEDISHRLDHRHTESSFQDIVLQPLLPYKLSQLGPGVSWIDYGQNGYDDLFIGSGKGGQLSIFRNLGNGQFESVEVGDMNTVAPGDQTAIVGWGEGNHTNIVVGSANYEQGTDRVPSAYHYELQPSGKITRNDMPGILSTTGPIAVADYDGDGNPDLFVGGRFKPGRYPEDSDSRLFKYENGQFQLDEINSRKLQNIGLVTDAVFTDFDGDGDQDLIISRAWDSIMLFENRDGIFYDISSQVGLDQYKGWWTGIATGDFNNNGRPDLVATNIGKNSAYQLDSDKPLKIYYEDFNDDGHLDIIEARYDNALGGYVPRRYLYEFGSLANHISHEINHREFAQSTVSQIFGRDFMTVPSKELNKVQSMIFLYNGSRYIAKPLPPEAQFTAALYAGVADYDNDGNEDIFLSQNFFSFLNNTPRLDAGRGLWLKGDGNGNFTAVSGDKTGIKIYGEQRGAALGDFNNDGRVDLVVTQNGGETKLYLNRTARQGIRVKLVGPRTNKDGIGSNLHLVYEDGRMGPLREVQAGTGYWSQNSSVQVLGADGSPQKIRVTWFDGRKQDVNIVENKMEYVIKY